MSVRIKVWITEHRLRFMVYKMRDYLSLNLSKIGLDMGSTSLRHLDGEDELKVGEAYRCHDQMLNWLAKKNKKPVDFHELIAAGLNRLTPIPEEYRLPAYNDDDGGPATLFYSYRMAVGNNAVDGSKIPLWDDAPDHVRDAWRIVWRVTQILNKEG